jgi:hypothetical protein
MGAHGIAGSVRLQLAPSRYFGVSIAGLMGWRESRPPE